jgi:hypothetical protein
VATWSQTGGGQFNFLGKNLQTTAVNHLAKGSGGARVFPNPAHGSAVLVTDGVSANNASCLLMDATGRLVKEVSIKNNGALIEQGSLPAGLYIYEVRSNGISISRGKVDFE